MKIRSAVGIFAFVLVFVPACAELAMATAVKLEIPKQGWSIAFDSPALSQPQESRRGEGEYAFKANSGRFNISLFVENPGGPGRTHRDCYESPDRQGHGAELGDPAVRARPVRHRRGVSGAADPAEARPLLLHVSTEVGRRAHLDHRSHQSRRGYLRGLRSKPALRILTRPPGRLTGSVAPTDTTGSPGRAGRPGLGDSA